MLYTQNECCIVNQPYLNLKKKRMNKIDVPLTSEVYHNKNKVMITMVMIPMKLKKKCCNEI